MKLAIAFLLVLPLCGCLQRHHLFESSRTSLSSSRGVDHAASNQMVFSYSDRAGQAVLESDRVILVFDDFSGEQRRAFKFQNNRQAIQVAGDGTSSVGVHCRRNNSLISYKSSYASGTNTVQFGAACMRFVDGGRVLLIGEQQIDLGVGKKQVHLTGEEVVVTD